MPPPDDKLVDYAYDFIKDIIETFGPRFSCSKAERDANEWIKKEIGTYCDETYIEDFETHPTLYPTGIFVFTGVLAGLGFFFMPFVFPVFLASLGLVIAGLMVLYTEMFLIKRWIAPFFKKGTSSNTFGIIKPKGEVRARVIFEGHTDSAKQMKIAEYERLPLKRFLLGILYLVVTLVFPLVKLVTFLAASDLVLVEAGLFRFTLVDAIYYGAGAVLFPCFVFVIRGFVGKVDVPGASDNLSGSAVAAAIGKHFAANRLQHVELVIGSFGSEENGDQGAKDFVARHAGILGNAMAFIMDDVGSGNKFHLVEKDFHLHGGLTYSEKVIRLVEQAHEAFGKTVPDPLPMERKRLPFGSSDACMYTMAGFDATFIVSALEPTSSGEKKIAKPANWHSVRDTWQNIKKRTLRDAIGIGIEFVKLVDAGAA